MPIDWMSRANALRDELIERRRDLHRHPELAFEEVRTAGIVARELGELGLEVTTGVGKTGVVGILDGQRDGPTVMIRCDMDALPVTEANSTDYVSETAGKMHACGHDGHTAIGLAVARMLTSERDRIAGRVKFVFQPAEEVGFGALAMIEDGVLGDPAPQICLGLHLRNDMPLGEIGLAAGPIMSGADIFTITVRGSGGHGALPEQTHDPIVAGAQIVSALQTIVSRNVSGLDTAVVSVTMFHAGDAMNVIPPEAKLSGTLRSYTPQIHELVICRVQEIATGVALALQCEAHVEINASSPPVINDSTVTARLHQVYSRIETTPPLRWSADPRWMAAEDMAFFLEKVPGTFMFVGSANPARQLIYPHHHPRFDFDEAALPIGAGLLATAVADYVLPD
jgi:amidohydrolase